MLAACLAIGLATGSASVQSTEARDTEVCTALRIIVEPLLYERVPPPGVSELSEFMRKLNEELATLRNQIEEVCHR